MQGNPMGNILTSFFFHDRVTLKGKKGSFRPFLNDAHVERSWPSSLSQGLAGY